MSGEVITLRPRLVLTNASTLDIELCLGRSTWGSNLEPLLNSPARRF